MFLHTLFSTEICGRFPSKLFFAEAQLKAYNEELAKFPADGLNRADSLSLRLLKKSVAECLYGYTFRAWLMPLSLLEGPQV
jgi:hypothetical protein